MKNNVRLISLGFILATLLAAGMAQQRGAQREAPLTVEQAVAIALEKSPARKMALAETAIAKAGVESAKAGFYPRAEFSETITLGNDPVFAFGSRLRQGRFTNDDFALNRLNYPDPMSDFATRIGGSWQVFDSFASQRRLRGSRYILRAAQRQLTRDDQELIYRVLESYYGVLNADKQIELAEQTVKTAQSVLETAANRVDAGTAVEADKLAAQVNLSMRQQELVRARNGRLLSAAQLGSAMGIPLLAERIPASNWREIKLPSVELASAEASAVKQRADLEAAAWMVKAQRESLQSAKSAYGPSLNLLGAWQADGGSLLGNGGHDWMVGAELKVTLFDRGRSAQIAAQKAVLTRAEAVRQAAEQNVLLDVRRAYYDYDTARQVLEVARGGIAQADESLRIMQDRYQSGLATATELLRAEDAAQASRTNYWQSVYVHITRYVALQLACGELTEQSIAAMHTGAAQ